MGLILCIGMVINCEGREVEVFYGFKVDLVLFLIGFKVNGLQFLV